MKVAKALERKVGSSGSAPGRVALSVPGFGLSEVFPSSAGVCACRVMPVVGVPSACAPGHATIQCVRDVPDLPAGAEAGFEFGQRLLRGGHLSLRSVSAASIV